MIPIVLSLIDVLLLCGRLSSKHVLGVSFVSVSWIHETYVFLKNGIFYSHSSPVSGAILIRQESEIIEYRGKNQCRSWHLSHWHSLAVFFSLNEVFWGLNIILSVPRLSSVSSQTWICHLTLRCDFPANILYAKTRIKCLAICLSKTIQWTSQDKFCAR